LCPAQGRNTFLASIKTRATLHEIVSKNDVVSKPSGRWHRRYIFSDFSTANRVLKPIYDDHSQLLSHAALRARLFSVHDE